MNIVDIEQEGKFVSLDECLDIVNEYEIKSGKRIITRKQLNVLFDWVDHPKLSKALFDIYKYNNCLAREEDNDSYYLKSITIRESNVLYNELDNNKIRATINLAISLKFDNYIESIDENGIENNVGSGYLTFMFFTFAQPADKRIYVSTVDFS